MARRMTDSEKWRDPWFSELKAELKLFWLYILDNCGHAGIWKVNRRLAEFEVGASIPWGEGPEGVPPEFDSRVVVRDGYWFIPKFLVWQYGKNLEKGDAVKSALESIVSKGFYEGLKRVYGGSQPPLGRGKAKAKAKAISKAKEEEGDIKGGKKFQKPTLEEIRLYCLSRQNQVDHQKFFNYYESNGWRVGKNPMKDWHAAVRTWERNDGGGINARGTRGNQGMDREGGQKHSMGGLPKLWP